MLYLHPHQASVLQHDIYGCHVATPLRAVVGNDQVDLSDVVVVPFFVLLFRLL